MKANQFSKDNNAQVGIGTMIVFIATILVAAIAAGVLISTSQKLQDKSTRTGTEATASVGTSLDVLSVYGKREVASGDLDRLEIWIQLSHGSEPVNLDEVIIQYKTKDTVNTYDFADNSFTTAYAGSNTEEFLVYDDDGTTLSTERVLKSGERHMLLIGSNTAGGTTLGLPVSTKVSLSLVPAVGVTVGSGFQTPATYDQDKVFELV
jgi:archaeal flagellin FlaB